MLKKEPQGLDSTRRTISQKVDFEDSKCGSETLFFAVIVKCLLEKFSAPSISVVTSGTTFVIP